MKSKGSDNRVNKKSGRPRGRPPKDVLTFRSKTELNNMVGLYIEENLPQIIDQYQYEIIQYFEENGYMLIDSNYTGGDTDGLDKETRIAKRDEALFRHSASCGLSYEDTL